MHPSRYSSVRQLANVMAGFVLTIILLESEALLLWAQRLEVGYGRSSAVKATAILYKTVQPLGVEWVRKESLTGLDRLGWSDDPARLEAARESDTPGAAGVGRHCAAMVETGSLPVPVDTTKAALRGTGIPVSPSVPKSTPLPQLPRLSGEKPREVALVGDSMMAVGLSDVVLREAATNENLRIVKAFRSGTGLARPDVFDWMKEYPAMIAGEHPDAIIVAIGANDGQGFVEDGRVLAFGSEGWVKVYQQRTAAFLNLLTQDGARVVWVGLPPMKSGQYNDKIEEINRIAYTAVSQYPQASWWNPLPYIGDEAGGYRELGTTPGGRTRRIRTADGIHLSDEGAALIVPELMNWLNPVTAQLEVPKVPNGH